MVESFYVVEQCYQIYGPGVPALPIYVTITRLSAQKGWRDW
jgi:hypothetical protein